MGIPLSANYSDRTMNMLSTSSQHAVIHIKFRKRHKSRAAAGCQQSETTYVAYSRLRVKIDSAKEGQKSEDERDAMEECVRLSAEVFHLKLQLNILTSENQELKDELNQNAAKASPMANTKSVEPEEVIECVQQATMQAAPPAMPTQTGHNPSKPDVSQTQADDNISPSDITTSWAGLTIALVVGIVIGQFPLL